MHHFRRVGSGLVCRSPARNVLRASIAYDSSAEEGTDHSHYELPPRFLPSPVGPRSLPRKGALHLKGPFHLWPWVVAQGFPQCPLLPEHYADFGVSTTNLAYDVDGSECVRCVDVPILRYSGGNFQFTDYWFSVVDHLNPRFFELRTKN